MPKLQPPCDDIYAAYANMVERAQAEQWSLKEVRKFYETRRSGLEEFLAKYGEGKAPHLHLQCLVEQSGLSALEATFQGLQDLGTVPDQILTSYHIFTDLEETSGGLGTPAKLPPKPPKPFPDVHNRPSEDN